ncbi:oxidoreductase, partial [Billgrantia endophytica]
PIKAAGSEPIVIAEVIFRAASDDAAYTTGAEWLADGGFMLGPVEPS